MSNFTVIVSPARTFGYIGRVERGTIHSYSVGSTGVRKWRPTAEWAKVAGERWIKRWHRDAGKAHARRMHAQRVTGYEAVRDE